MWIEKLPDGRFKYIERYVDPYTEKQKRVSTILTSESPQAIKKATKILDEKIEKKLSSKDFSALTFGMLYTEWYKYYKQHVKRSSWSKVPKMMKHINKQIADDVLIKNIDESLIQKIIEDMYTFGSLSLNYTKQTKTTLSVMLNYAVKRKYLERNPALSVTVERKKSEEEKKKITMDKKFLESDEVNRILKAMYSDKKRILHGQIAEFLYLTGLRYGELQALQVKNYDGHFIFVNGTLDYSFTKIKNAVKTTPKNIFSNRKVELSNRAIEIMQEVLLDNFVKIGPLQPDDYIFVSNRGTPLTLHSFNQILHSVEAEIGINKSLSSHIFRHSHISLLAELNVPIKAIMERVGHNDATTTLSIYNHATSKAKKQVVDKLNSL